MDTLAFPQPTTTQPSLPAPKAPAGLAWRPATAADIGFLRALYGELRAMELAGVAWPAALKRDFLDQQFTLQHRSYTTRFADADFLLVEQAGHPIGRLYLDRHGAHWHLVDIGLLAAAQGHGIGTALIGQVQALAGKHGAGLDLHVRLDNPRARALYERLGFRAGARNGQHLAMHHASRITQSRQLNTAW